MALLPFAVLISSFLVFVAIVAAGHLIRLVRYRTPLTEEAQSPILNPAHPSAPLTVFYAGNGNTIRQAARYTGGAPVAGYRQIRSTALLYNVQDDPQWSEPCDVDYDPANVPLLYRLITPAFQRFSLWYHGAFPVLNNRIPIPYIHPGRSNFAQEGDLARHRSMLWQTLQSDPNQTKPIVLFGTSRGASTTLASVLRIYRDAPHLLQRVKAVILEAPFANVDEVLRHRFGETFVSIASTVLAYATQYRPTTEANAPLTPMEMATKLPWPEHIPLLVVSTQGDTVVPSSHAIALAMTLEKANPKMNISLCHLAHSTHGTMSMDNNEDATKYRQCMHAFLKDALKDSPEDMWLE